MQKYIISMLLWLIAAGAYAQTQKEPIRLADPTIFYENHTYYLYGTGDPDGFAAYTSTNLKDWLLHDKKALTKGESYGSKGFWAPQLFKHKGKYYMAYTADEHIAIASADSPLGPFTQSSPRPVSLPGRDIDPFIFKDSNGDLYLYYVRVQDGNRIFVTRLKDDLSDVEEKAEATQCIRADQPWENTANASWPVTEGPTVVKRNGVYYLFYSANDFRNIDYAVGYATSNSPIGPWSKYSGNPIISRNNIGQNGSGHGDLLVAKDGKLYYVLHTHSSSNQVGQRKTGIVRITVRQGAPDTFSIKPASFRFLQYELSPPVLTGK